MKRAWMMALLAALASPASAQPAPAPITPAQIVERHSSQIALREGRLSGPGADALLEAARDAQFLIVIESHNDHITPQVTGALFSALQGRGFNYLAIEQDPFGMAAASSPGRRGRIDGIAEHARAYPYSYTFSTDEELQLLAQAGQASRGRGQPIWGFDQAFGATLPLTELLSLARTPAARAAVDRLLQEAREVESRRGADGVRDQANSHFVSSNPRGLLTRLAEIRRLMAPRTRSRAAELIDALQSSAEIYSYYDPQPPTDAAGTPRGLLNNTVREDLMKRSFMRLYRAAEAADRRAPRVVVKAGWFHTARGLSDNGVFTLGNFLHEFAIANDNRAISVQVLPLREWWPSYESIEPHYRALLPSRALDRGTLVDLRPLRAHLHGGQAFGLSGTDLRRFRQLVFGVDFALFIPSQPGRRTLTTVQAATAR